MHPACDFGPVMTQTEKELTNVPYSNMPHMTSSRLAHANGPGHYFHRAMALVLLTAFAQAEAAAQYPVAPAAPGSQSAAPDWIGICLMELSTSERKDLRIGDRPGAIVAGVWPGSPAAAAGLVIGDLIVAINDVEVVSAEQLANKTKPVVLPGAGPLSIIFERDRVRWRVVLNPVVTPAALVSATRQVAESGEAWAQYELAKQLLGANPPDEIEAQVWMGKAANQGLAIAQATQGAMLLAGEGTTADPKRGIELMTAAAVAGLESAQYQLGLVHMHGMGVPKDSTSAAIWFLVGAHEGHAPSQFLAGCLFEEAQPPDHASALYWLNQAAAQNLPEANSMVSVFHRNGWGVPKSDTEANRYLLLAANAGHAPSQFLFGQVCAQGLGVQKDLGTAVGWFRAAAELGDVDAQLALGTCYQNGEGVEANAAEAKRWLEKAADAGNSNAELPLALALASADTAEAMVWLKRAANSGVADAQFFLANAYMFGNGVPKSRTAATFWYRRAIAQGHKGAENYFNQVVRKSN